MAPCKENIEMLQILVTTLFALALLAASWGGSEVEASEASKGVVIVNQTDKKIHFELRPLHGKWKEFSIRPHLSSTIFCSSCTSIYYEFRMGTPAERVHYRVQSGKEYFVEQSRTRNRLDLFLPR